MTSLMKRDKKIERNKRYLAMGTTGVGVALAIGVAPLLGVPVVGLGAYLGWDWFKFRAKRGMRF